MRRILSALALASSLTASASSLYPTTVKTKLGLADFPDCSLCHLNGITGTGTVNTPFGKSMRTIGGAQGGSQTAKIEAALATLEAMGTDSDGDGTPDIAELKAGRDPNVKDAPADAGAGGGSADGGASGGGTAAGGGSATGGGSSGGGGTVIPPPKFGCGADVAPGLLTMLGAAVFFARRRR